MEILNYEFETREEREMAFHNIVKWYGSQIVTKVEFLELKVQASREITTEAGKIMEKHQGRRKH